MRSIVIAVICVSILFDTFLCWCLMITSAKESRKEEREINGENGRVE